MKTVYKTATFTKWIGSLRDRAGRARIQARIDRAAEGHYGDCKAVGEGVIEMRIHFGPGYRVYFVERGKEVVVLLAGGTKSGQSRDIKQAIVLAQQL